MNYAISNGPLALSLIFQATLLSLDSLVVSFAISPLFRSTAQRLRWAALFGLCDCLAVMLGSVAGARVLGFAFAEWAIPLLVLCSGVYCLVAAFWNKFRVNSSLAAALPVLMSLDNLVYGFGIAPAHGDVVARAVIFGIASFAMAMVGISLGQFMRSPDLRTTEKSAGLALLAASLVLFLS